MYLQILFVEILKEANGEEVRIEIASPGGFVYDGIEIFNLIKRYSGKTTTHLIGLAASMASYIALAGDKITSEKNAVYMIHNVWSGVVGDHEEMRKTADNIEGLTKLLANEYSEKTGLSVDEIREMMNNETFLFGEEIKNKGFVDEITSSNSEDQTVNKNDELIKAKADVKGCISLMDELKEGSDDLKKAVAVMGNINTKKTKTKEYPKMATLKEILDANPEAKKEYEEKINSSKPSEANGEEKKDDYEYAMNFIGNEKYAKAAKLAAKVAAGKASKEVLEIAIATIDELTEGKVSTDAKAESEKLPETPASNIEKEQVEANEFGNELKNIQGV